MVNYRKNRFFDTRFRRLIVLTTASVILVGCGSWPPLENELMEHFGENRAEIMTLGRHFLDLGVPLINSSKKRGGVLRPGKEPNSVNVTYVEGKLEDDANELMHNLGISSIRQIESSVVFELKLTGRLSQRFVISYVHGDLDSDAPDCGAKLKELDSGICKTALESNWRLVYQWFGR